MTFSLPDPKVLADKLLKRVEITEPPVRMERVVSVWQNLSLTEEDLDGAGYLLPIGDIGAEILVNRNNSDARRAFTIAHEVGHWVLGLICKKKFGTFIQPPGLPKVTIEKWCDAFATNLLMPAQLVRTWLPPKDQPLLVDSILRAAAKFGVSEEAFYIRVWELEQVQVAALSLRPEPRVDRTYGDSERNEKLAAMLRQREVGIQLQMASSMIYFKMLGTSGTVCVSGRKFGHEKAILALAWPPSS